MFVPAEHRANDGRQLLGHRSLRGGLGVTAAARRVERDRPWAVLMVVGGVPLRLQHRDCS